MKVSAFGLSRIELPTVALILTCYLVWTVLAFTGDMLHPALWILISAINITFFWSLVHEVVHGHPTDNRIVNRLLVILPIGWVFPYERFRDTHIEHHETGELTDPFDDPESWYLPQSNWQKTGRLGRAVLEFNNTLFGRMLIGPVLSLTRFYWSEISILIKGGDKGRYLARVWMLHILLCGLTVSVLYAISSAPLWQHAIAGYLGLSFLLIRTFLEHQAAEDQSERTVIIEKSCPIAFLFLFNNLHFIHHAKPGIPWYELPALYRSRREEYLEENKHYVYKSYGEVFRKFFFKPKEAVPHPFVVDAKHRN